MTARDARVCIHGHFYQPPRENPWLEDVEMQDSAHPYHDWNERITTECYLPNSAARVLGEKKLITDIVKFRIQDDALRQAVKEGKEKKKS